MMETKEKRLFSCTDRMEWRRWLCDHFETENEIWFVFPLKDSGEEGISYNDAVEEALCFGWIDGIAGTLDEKHHIRRFTPRRKKSPYSRPNIERLIRMQRLGKIHPKIREQVKGIIDAPFVFPEDILDELKKDDAVWRNFQAFTEPYKRIRIAYIDAARKRPGEFEKRLRSFIDKTRKNKLITGYGGIESYYRQGVDMKGYIGYCGLDCENCDARIATVNDDDVLREKTAKLWSELNQTQITKEMINCTGCRIDGVKTPFCDQICQIRKCAMKKGYETCGECGEMEGCELLKVMTKNDPAMLKNLKADRFEYVTLRERPELEDEAADWFHLKWGVDKQAYLECMDAYLNEETEYGWYLCLDDGKIVGGLGVIENDFHHRKDLAPNICAVYTEEGYRGKGIAGALLNKAVEDMRDKGISPVYLLTDHNGFYEKYGWKFLCLVQGDGESHMSRMYVHK